MRVESVIVAALLLVCASLVSASAVIDEQLIRAVNTDPSAKWVAGVNEKFVGMSVDDAKKLMGVLPDNHLYKLPEQPLPAEEVMSSLPDRFDSRQQWSQCPGIGHIRDQANCGSCWAMSSTEAANDRVCIGSNGQNQVSLSAADMLSCSRGTGMGCGGGYLGPAWRWLEKHGLVTGGDYGRTDVCYAYQLAPCAHRVESDKYPPCPPEVGTPRCPKKCAASYSTNDWAHDATKLKSAYGVSSREDAIRAEIMAHGPVQTAFQVYEDFVSYKSGVYSHKTGGLLGGHAVKILGWDLVDGEKAWIVANSWNESWGNNGTFLIKRGNNECGFESSVTAGLAQGQSK